MTSVDLDDRNSIAAALQLQGAHGVRGDRRGRRLIAEPRRRACAEQAVDPRLVDEAVQTGYARSAPREPSDSSGSPCGAAHIVGLRLGQQPLDLSIRHAMVAAFGAGVRTRPVAPIA